jgi:hypothetical protein
MVEKKQAVKWIILKRFVFGNKVYNLGEEVPPFMPNKEKEKLYKQEKIGKLNSDGSIDKHIVVFEPTEQDKQNIANSPQLIAYIIGEYILYKEDLQAIWDIVLKRAYASQFEKLFTEKLETSPEKPKPTVAEKETVETKDKGEKNGK